MLLPDASELFRPGHSLPRLHTDPQTGPYRGGHIPDKIGALATAYEERVGQWALCHSIEMIEIL